MSSLTNSRNGLILSRNSFILSFKSLINGNNSGESASMIATRWDWVNLDKSRSISSIWILFYKNIKWDESIDNNNVVIYKAEYCHKYKTVSVGIIHKLILNSIIN